MNILLIMHDILLIYLQQRHFDRNNGKRILVQASTYGIFLVFSISYVQFI